jgi:hypothetical protein
MKMAEKHPLDSLPESNIQILILSNFGKCNEKDKGSQQVILK